MRLIFSLALLLALTSARAGELIVPAPTLDPYGTQTLLKIQGNPGAKSVRVVGVDEASLKGNTLTLTIDGRTVQIVGHPSKTGWSGVGTGDGNLTNSLSVQRTAEGFIGLLRFEGKAFEVRPLGKNAYALVELDTTRKPPPDNSTREAPPTSIPAPPGPPVPAPKGEPK